MREKLFCIYHGQCDDGFMAAWCVRHALGHDAVEFFPGAYQETPPDVTGRHVLFVDFSYKRPVLEEMAKTAKSIIILDHHKTAAADLADFRPPAPYGMWNDKTLPLVQGDLEPIVALFDMKRSGAGMAWDYFHPGHPRPLFVDYVEDRDLWHKKLPYGDEFTIGLRSYHQSWAVWDELFPMDVQNDDGTSVKRLITEGKIVQRYYRGRVEELKRNSYLALINFADRPPVTCRIANAPYFAASEVAGELANDTVDFGASFFQLEDGRWQYSLRSRANGFDVSALALLFGGGGHAAAAGFTVSEPVHARC